ncbi:hypothetical protein D3C73_1601120 [compost metagenome]
MQQLLDIGDGIPGGFAAAVAPLLDGVKDGFFPVAAKAVADVDDQNCRACSESGLGVVPGAAEYLFVTIG